jgi:Mrp family chromosome partitioning ATPase
MSSAEQTSEPTPEPEVETSLATIKQLKLGNRTTSPETAEPNEEAKATSRTTADQPPLSTWAAKGGGLDWTSARPEVLQSCSMALRRMGDSGSRSIAVTSTARGEGRTTVAIGLAATASMEFHRKAVLLDLDLDQGAIEKTTSVGPGPGVLDYLYDEAPLEDCLQKVDERVEIMRAGQRGDRSWDGAPIGRLADLVQQLSSRCDVVIADLPALSDRVTAALAADLFESVILVVRAGGVAVPRVEQAASVLTQRPFVILNGTAEARPSRLRRILSLRP